MMKNSKFSIVLGGVLGAALLVSGCGSAASAGSSAASSAADTAAASSADSGSSDTAAASDQTSETSDTAAASSASSASASSVASTDLQGEVTAAGSSALLPLVQAAADSFMEENPNLSIVTNGGGSGEGLKQVADGTVDIGNSDVFAEEKLDADQAAGLVDHEVCTITMAPVVNAALDVDNLTTDQLISIFTGKTTNWKDVGGPDLEIMLVTRPSSSGTRALFKQWALNGEEEASNESLETDDSGTLLQTIQQNEGAIGYVALSYLVNNTDVKAVSIDGVEPTLENTYSGDYKVWGFEHMYTNGEGSEQAQAFINYIMNDYSDQLESMGYGVASKMTSAAIDSHNQQ